MGTKDDPSKLPKIFQVNWFRKDSNGKFLWPGFGENSRVVAWIIGRISQDFEGVDSPLGRLPATGELNVAGLSIDQNALNQLFEIDANSWSAEIETIKEFFAEFGPELPSQLTAQLSELESRLELVS
jgi:phosphoenolpyruvate carboxykinase (GTP)